MLHDHVERWRRRMERKHLITYSHLGPIRMGRMRETNNAQNMVKEKWEKFWPTKQQFKLFNNDNGKQKIIQFSQRKMMKKKTIITTKERVLTSYKIQSNTHCCYRPCKTMTFVTFIHASLSHTQHSPIISNIQTIIQTKIDQKKQSKANHINTKRQQTKRWQIENEIHEHHVIICV